MLVQKKISTKKLVIYLAIIFFMVSGAGFMLYQSKKLTAGKTTEINAPIVFNNSVPVASTTAGNQAAAGPSQISDMNKANQNGGLDLSIFSSDKFKMLRENMFLVKEPPEAGKRDPFKPN